MSTLKDFKDFFKNELASKTEVEIKAIYLNQLKSDAEYKDQENLRQLDEIAQQKRKQIVNIESERLAYYNTKATLAHWALSGDAKAIAKIKGEADLRKITTTEMAELILKKHFVVYDQADKIEEYLSEAKAKVKVATTTDDSQKIINDFI